MENITDLNRKRAHRMSQRAQSKYLDSPIPVRDGRDFPPGGSSPRAHAMSLGHNTVRLDGSASALVASHKPRPFSQRIHMTLPASPLASQAEALLAGQFARLREPTKYIATFRTKNGRHIALTRQAKDDLYIWTECVPEAMDGVAVRNQKSPGQPYSPEQPRSSNLTNASKQLGVGNQAFYLKIDTLGTLERLARWYDAC
jgi:hypothetical protein